MAASRNRRPRRAGSKRSQATAPWIWLLIGLLLGLFVALAVYLYLNTKAQPVVEVAKQAAPKKPAPAVAKKPAANPPAETKPRFDFYRLLPEREVIVADDDIGRAGAENIASAPLPEVQTGGQYLLQAGAFKTFAQADQLKAQLALIGVEANIETVKINDTVAWHRVRVGPYTSLDKVDAVKQRLKANSVDSVVLKVN